MEYSQDGERRHKNPTWPYKAGLLLASKCHVILQSEQTSSLMFDAQGELKLPHRSLKGCSRLQDIYVYLLATLAPFSHFGEKVTPRLELLERNRS